MLFTNLNGWSLHFWKKQQQSHSAHRRTRSFGSIKWPDVLISQNIGPWLEFPFLFSKNTHCLFQQKRKRQSNQSGIQNKKKTKSTFIHKKELFFKKSLEIRFFFVCQKRRETPVESHLNPTCFGSENLGPIRLLCGHGLWRIYRCQQRERRRW